MKLSIITINYNNLNGLKKTAKSIISQTYRDYEWIIIDGGSEDGSKDFLVENDSLITYWVSESDRGVYHAMNKGIQASVGDYLLFLNSGDYLFNNNVLENVCPYLKDVDFYVGDIYHSDQIGVSIVQGDLFSSEKVLNIMVMYAFPHQSTFIRRKAFERWGMYREDKRIVSDWYFMFQSLLSGRASLSYLPLVISVYDVTGISSVNKHLFYAERESLMHENPYIYPLYNFYRINYDIIKSIRDNKFVFFIYRIYFYFYRKMHFK
jgi:glycosyltransferase involved in cell wall biosynthesis